MTTQQLLEICQCGGGNCNLTCSNLKNVSAFRTLLVPETTADPAQTFPQEWVSPLAFQNRSFPIFGSRRTKFLLHVWSSWSTSKF